MGDAIIATPTVCTVCNNPITGDRRLDMVRDEKWHYATLCEVCMDRFASTLMQLDKILFAVDREIIRNKPDQLTTVIREIVTHRMCSMKQERRRVDPNSQVIVIETGDNRDSVLVYPSGSTCYRLSDLHNKLFKVE